MSAEGKKKRGIAGMTKAQSIPHRHNGWPEDWQARAIGAYRGAGAPSSGSTTMRGVIGGILASHLGYPMYGNLDHVVGHAIDRCTHPLLTDSASDDLAEAAE